MLLLSYCCFSLQAIAEGSKDMIANGGHRSFFLSTTTVTIYDPFPTLGTVKVYVKEGETLYLGSSAVGTGSGAIKVRRVGGGPTLTNPAGIGRINNIGQELVGPSLNGGVDGGYVPYTITVAPGQAGIWEVDFIAPSNNATNSGVILANAAWTQNDSRFIAAFDVSVRNSANTAFIKGRAFMNVFGGNLGDYNALFRARFKILTKDGYQYDVNNNGQGGYQFVFFVNNKGFRDTNGDPLYKSVNTTSNPPVHDPRSNDTATDITHKIFFSEPSSDMPTSAPTPSGSTWLLNTPVSPTVSNFLFKGKEGTFNMGGTYPLGGYITFEINQPGNYILKIDINKNGSFDDPIDVRLTGAAATGANKIYWNGLNGLNNPVPGNFTFSPTDMSLSLIGGEVHFPFLDVENNVNGIIITRINGVNAPQDIVYWDDRNITSTSNPSSPRFTDVNGISSSANGHKWGSTAYNDNSFGNEVGLDTWAYVVSSPVLPFQNIQLKQADLEIVNITANKPTSYCVGENIVYTIRARNNGPDNVTNAKFAFNFPSDYVVSAVSYTATPVASVVVSNPSQTAISYTANLDMENQAVITFTITGKLSAYPAGGTVPVNATIMRPADVTDPDATNPDDAPPIDPLNECDSGVEGCNNRKTHSTVSVSTVNISIAGSGVTEGTGGTANINFPVTLSAVSNCDISVNYTINHITTNNADFAGNLTGTITIPAGQTLRYITIPVVTDNIIEANEEFNVVLSAATGGNSIIATTAVGTIVNDDSAQITVTVTNAFEENAINGRYVFSFPNGITADRDVEIDYILSGGTATENDDFTRTNTGTLIIPAGSSTAELNINVIDDIVVEGTETILLNVTALRSVYSAPLGGNITVNASNNRLYIFDNDKASVSIIPSVTETEGDAGNKSFTFYVTLNAPTSSAFTLNFKTSNGSAIASEDYLVEDRVISFNGTAQTIPVTVSIIGDNKIESDEYFHVTISDLSNNYNGNLSISQAASVGNIINDDTGILNISSVSTSEGAAAAQFIFSLLDGKIADTDIIINYTLTGKANGNGVDYDKPQTGTITLPKGQNSVTLYLNTYDDNLVEGIEDVVLTINSISHAVVSVPVNTSSLTITDINQAHINVADVQVTEGNAGTTLLRFKAILTGRTDTDFTLPFTVQGITATAGTDYTVTTISPISFSPNLATQEIDIDIAVSGDYDIEGNETLQLVLGTPSKTFSGGLIVQSSPATGTIIDDDNGQITVTPTHGKEENQEAVVFTFAFPAGVSNVNDTEINFTLAGSTATAGADYTPPTVYQVTIPAGDNSVNLAIPVINDDVVEGSETIVLTPSPIINNPGVTINTNAVTALIEDNDTGTFTLSGPATVPEGDVGVNTTINYTIKLNKEIQNAVQLSYRTADGTAIAGEDYDGVLNTYTFPAGLSEQEITIPVTIRGDRKIEANEVFRLLMNPLLNDFGGRITLSNPFVETTIINDDNANISINKINGIEGSQDARFTIGFDNGYSTDVAINIPYTLSGSAQNPGDYTGASSGILTINPGQSAVQLDLPVVNDNLVENTENVTITLANTALPYNILFVTGQETLNIIDNDAASVSIANASVTEGDENDNYLVFDVTLTGSDIQDAFTLPFTITEGTATLHQDYELPASTLINFNGPADRAKQIQVLVKGDLLIEKNETLNVILGSLSDNFGGRLTINNTTATGTIANNDKGTIQIVPADGNEEGAVAGTFRFNFLNGITADEPTTINFNLSGAQAPADYTTPNLTTVTIPAGATFADVVLSVIDDEVIENTETVTLTTTGAIGTVYPTDITIANSPQTLNILDNDNGELLLTADPDILEGADGQSTTIKFKVKLTRATAAPFSVNYQFADITAVNGADYQGANATLNFLGNKDEVHEVTATIIGDYKIEADESFRFVISNPSNMFNGKLTVPLNNKIFTIKNDDGAKLSIDKQDGVEGGNDGYFTISLPGDYTLDQPVQISYTLSGATTDDYAALPGNITLPANTKSINIPIVIIDDAKIEGDEFLTITANIITPVYGISFVSNQNTLKIGDNDFGTVFINNVSVNEEDSGEHTLSFEVSLDTDTESTFGVNYKTENGTATAGEDYEAVANGNITLSGTKDEIQHISVKYYGDKKVEANETFRVILESLTKTFDGHLSIKTTANTGTATLINDDNAVVNVAATPGSENGTKGVFRFYLENGAVSDKPLTLTYTLGGTALNVSAKKDYDITHPTTVTIPAGENFVDVELTINDDEIAEGTETVQLVNLQLFTDYTSEITLSTVIPVLTIGDNDTAKLIISAPVEIVEGNSGNQFYRFAVKLNTETADIFDVNYTVTDGTAKISDGDYSVNPTGTLNFLGEKNEEKYIDVQINGDHKIEPDEDFIVTFADPSKTFENRLTIPDKIKTGIIKNDDLANIVITKQDGAEGGQPASFIFTLANSKTVDEDILINYTLDNTSAIAGTDFTVSAPSPLTLSKGSNSITLTLNVNDDNIIEGTETVRITAQTQNNPRNNIIISNPTLSLDITDNDDATLTISNPEVVEGQSGETNLVFTVGLNKETQRPFTVTYHTQDDTALANEDYIPVTGGMVSFPARSTANQTITIKVKGDQKLEADEYLKVILSSLTDNFSGKLKLPAAAATGKIINDDLAGITISGTNGEEANEVAGTFKFSLPNNVKSDQPIKINYTLSGDALANGVDYTNALSGFVIIPANESEVTLNINVKDDNILEFNESVIIIASIDNSTAYAGRISLVNNTHSIYIDDNDSAKLTLSGATAIPEGNDGFIPVVYTVTLSNPVTAGFKVNYAIDEISATMADEDFEFSASELQFTGADATSATFTVYIKGDKKIEANENFRIKITPDQSFNDRLTVEGSPLLVEITNDDFGAISISKEDGEESILNNKPAKFVFSLPEGMSADQDIVLPYSLSVNSARGEGVDYTGSLTGNITIYKNDNQAELILPVIDDNIVEDTETVTIQVANVPLPNGVTLATSNQTLNIFDNDEAQITISDASVLEGNNGTRFLDFTVSLNKAVQETFTINYHTQNVTAIAGEDYQPISSANGSLTFNALSTAPQTIRVNVNTDFKIEADETMQVLLQTLSNNFGGRLRLPSTAGTGTILNDDSAIIAISGNHGKEAGALPGTFKFSLLNNAKSDHPIKINYTLSGSALGNNVDYNNAQTGEIIIPADGTEATLIINTKDDNIVEFNETVIITAAIAGETVYYPSNIALQENTKTIHIEDNDVATLTINGPLSITEGDFGTKTLTFNVTLSNPVNSSFTARYYSVNGTATTADNDYQAIDGTLSFTGQTVNETYPVQVTINGDTKIEGSEYFEILLDPLTENYGGRLNIIGSPARAIILDDDNANINKIITITRQNGEEGINDASFTFSFPPGVSLDTDTEIFFSLGGNAIKDTDYEVQGSATSMVIPAGQNSRTLNLKVNNDLIVEDTETVRIITANISNSLYQDIIIANPTVDLDILDNDTGTIRVDEASITEGNSNTKELVFNVVLSHETSKEFQLEYTTQDNTATIADNDYTSIAAGVLVLGPQDGAKTIRVSVNGDTNLEKDEMLNLILKPLVNDFSGRLTIVNQTIPGKIINDDTAVITITKTDGEEGASPVRFKFSFPQDVYSDEPTEITYNLGGTATANLDYAGNASGTITILPYQSSAELVLPVTDDVFIEGNETVSITAAINSVYGSAITLNAAIPVATIKDNDFAKLKINGPISVIEGNTGTTAVNFTVTLEGNIGESFEVRYSTQDGTATVTDNDYIPKLDNILTFSGSPGETKTITILVNGDKKIEADEHFFVNLHNLSKDFNRLLTIENSPASANVLDDDNNPANKTLTITKTNGSEVDLTPVTFTFSFPPGIISDAITTIPYSLSGTANGNGVDYDGIVSGNISIPKGENSLTLTLPVKADEIVEGTEIVRLVAGDVINGSYNGISVSDPTIDAEIADANTTTLSIADIEIVEGNTATRNAVFTIKLNGATAKPFTVDYSTADAIATTADFDYTSISGKLSFNGNAGEERKVTVLINGDKKLEADETFKLLLSNIQSNFNNRLTLDRTEAVATIKNDDDLLITVTGIDGAEAGRVPARFIFSLPAGYTSDSPTLINYTLAGQATAGGTDYEGSANGVIAIPAGAENVILTLPVKDDEIVEKDEDISIVINSINTNYPANVTYNPALPKIKIIDNDATVLRLSNAVQLPEGNSGTTAFTYSLTLEKATGTGFTIKYTTEDGTATLADNDYNKAEGSLSFAGNTGENHQITVFVNGDQKIEANELFRFRIFDLDSTFNNRLSVPVSVANGIIENEDSSQITITKVDGIEGTQDGKFDLVLDPGVTSDRDIIVEYRLSGMATASDYQALPSATRVTIPAGQNTTTIDLDITDDSTLEERETVVLNVNNIINPYHNVTVKQPIPLLNIFDNDITKLSITSPAAVIEGHSGVQSVTFTIKLDNNIDKGFSVKYTTVDGSATEADNDYQKKTGSLNFNGFEGESKTVTVLINGDTRPESNEFFGLKIYDLLPDFDGKLLLDTNGRATILNDDIPPVAADDFVTVIEDTPKTFSVIANDLHDEGIDPSSLTITILPEHGRITLQQDGTVTYAPVQDYFGNDKFFYTVRDVFGRYSNETKVNIVVTPVNDAPFANDDVYYVQKDSSIREKVSLNDFDVDGDVLQFRRITNPVHGNIAFFDVNDGSFIYVPTEGFKGIDRFTYYVQDPEGLRDTAEVLFYIQPKVRVGLTPNTGILIEGDSITITAKLTESIYQDVNLVLSFGGTALQDKDYNLRGNYDVITIPARDTITTHKFSIHSLKDYLKEDPETIEVSIQSADPSAFVEIGNGADIIINDFYPANKPVDSDENGDINPDPYMSPNGDGLGNEKFTIYNIERYPDNEVIIYNRWGNEVYNTKGYNNKDNAFNGTANTGLLANGNSPLVDGVYYFIIKTKGIDGKPKSNKGYVIIRR